MSWLQIALHSTTNGGRIVGRLWGWELKECQECQFEAWDSASLPRSFAGDVCWNEVPVPQTKRNVNDWIVNNNYGQAKEERES